MDCTSDSDNEEETKPVTQDDDVVQDCMGPMGKFQLFVILLLFTSKASTCFQPLGIVFLAPPVQYTCMDTWSNSTNTSATNTCPCNHPQYDRTVFKETITMTWDLICEREWLVSLNQTIFMLGLLVGSIVFGSLSDGYGRKISMLASAALEVVAGVLASIVTNYWLFLVLRFFIGCSIGGIFVVAFVLLIEVTGKKYRELGSCLLQLTFNIGYLLMPLMGYYIRTWQMINLAYSLPPALLLLTPCLLPEAPRWLLATGKTEEAIVVIERAAKMNNLPTEGIRDKIYQYIETKPKDDVKKATMLDIFRTRNLRKNVICMSINWIICAFGFFGLSQYIGQLSGNIFLNIGISAIMTILGTVFTYVGLNLMGRRTTMLGMHIATSCCLLIIAVIPQDYTILRVVLACIGNLGMFILISVIYLYCSELFPTVVRNAAMGVASMLSRIGSMVAPFVVSLNSTIPWLPPVIFGLAPLVAAGVCLLLPETKGRELPNTLVEGEQFVLMKKKKGEDNGLKETKIAS